MKTGKTKDDNVLQQLQRLYGLTDNDIVERTKLTKPTVRKYIRQPLEMRGHDRKKLAKVFDIPIDKMDDIVNGTIVNVKDLLN